MWFTVLMCRFQFQLLEFKVQLRFTDQGYFKPLRPSTPSPALSLALRSLIHLRSNDINCMLVIGGWGKLRWRHMVCLGTNDFWISFLRFLDRKVRETVKNNEIWKWRKGGEEEERKWKWKGEDKEENATFLDRLYVVVENIFPDKQCLHFPLLSLWWMKEKLPQGWKHSSF